MANDESVVVASVDKAKILGGPIADCSLKRKRPPKIEIPNVLREISTEIFKERSVSVSQGQSDGPVWFADSGVGVFSLKGKKKFMEDAYKVFASSNGNKRFFGVYDGHGGSKAAEFVAENLHLNVIEMLEGTSENHIKEEACKAGFLKTDENHIKEEACKAGFLKTDEEFLKQGLGSGACCVTALIEGRELVISNLGDCRAVVCRDGSAEALTTDHRPAREDERRRIEDKGGYVENHRGTWRVHGTLAVSRSIGDAHLKEWVLAEPDTKVVHLTPDMQYLVLASDGLWDEVSNQEAVDIVMQACSDTKQPVRSSQGNNRVVYQRKAPNRLSKSPRMSLVKSKRIFHPTSRKLSIQRKSSDEETCCENEIPPSKSRRISLPNQMKIKTHFPSNENEFLIDKRSAYGGLLAACKKLADLAVTRGSLDDVTVMIVDLNYCTS